MSIYYDSTPLYQLFGMSIPDNTIIEYEPPVRTTTNPPSPFKGQKHTEETKQAISANGRGLKRSEETKRRIGLAKRGLKLTEENKRQISQKKKGCTPWNKGKKTGPLSEDHKKILSEKALSRTATN